jgi:hypothetical protein
LFLPVNIAKRMRSGKTMSRSRLTLTSISPIGPRVCGATLFSRKLVMPSILAAPPIAATALSISACPCFSASGVAEAGSPGPRYFSGAATKRVLQLSDPKM